MKIAYALIITLVVYPLLGTLLFGLLEKISISIWAKVLILTLGHPLLTGVILWYGCSLFNHEIAETCVLLVGGSLLRVPFSDRRYFSRFTRDSKSLTIEYITPLMFRRTAEIPLTEIQAVKQSANARVIDKPLTLTLTTTDKTIEFDVLDKDIGDLDVT
jgi:hypothetical protein